MPGVPSLLSNVSQDADGTSIQSGTVAPVAGNPIYVAVVGAQADPSTTPTISGLSISWALVETIQTVSGSVRRNLSVFEGYPEDLTPGMITADFGSDTQQMILMHVVSWAGVDDTDSTLQSATATNSTNASHTISFGSTPDPGSVTAVFAAINNNSTLTVPAPYTTLATTTSASPVSTLVSAWSSLADDPADYTVAGGSARESCAVAIEVGLKAGPSIRSVTINPFNVVTTATITIDAFGGAGGPGTIVAAAENLTANENLAAAENLAPEFNLTYLVTADTGGVSLTQTGNENVWTFDPTP